MYMYIVYIVHESAADGSGAISRVEASVLFLLAGTSLILNQFRMIYRILVEIASPWYMSGGKKRACVGLPYVSGFVCFSYLPRSIHSIYVYMYTTTIGQQKSQTQPRCPRQVSPSYAPWCSTQWKIYYIDYILLSMSSQNWQLWRIFLLMSPYCKF